MRECCNLQYQTTFSDKEAQKELIAYQQGKIKKSSIPLVEIIRELPLNNNKILDIGGGIGALTFEAFKMGATQATHVDISKAYKSQFLNEATKLGLIENIDSILGDFVEHHQTIEAAELVVLDKVICCYESYSALIKHSVSKSLKWYAYTLPRDLWWVKLGNIVDTSLRRLNGRPLRSYIHPCHEIESLVLAEGFVLKQRDINREWQTLLYEKE